MRVLKADRTPPPSTSDDYLIPGIIPELVRLARRGCRRLWGGVSTRLFNRGRVQCVLVVGAAMAGVLAQVDYDCTRVVGRFLPTAPMAVKVGGSDLENAAVTADLTETVPVETCRDPLRGR